MAQRNSNYELIPGDLYVTPGWVTEALLSVEDFPEGVWEPADGGGQAMLIQLAKRYVRHVWGSDISSGTDFLACETIRRGFSSIITNPPYSKGLAVRFVRHALSLTQPVVGKVAMLMPHSWDTSSSRADLFKNCPAFKAKYTLTRRIRWVNLEQKKNGPSQNHAWFVWDWSRDAGPAELRWLP